MSFDDDFDVPLIDNTSRRLDNFDIPLQTAPLSDHTEHFFIVYPFYFNSKRLPKYIRDTYASVDVNIYHLIRAAKSIGCNCAVDWKRHPADLFHVGRLKVFTSKSKRELLFELAKQINVTVKEVEAEVVYNTQLAANGDQSKEDYLMIHDPFYIPVGMRKEEKSKNSSSPAKKGKKKNKK
eukprot:NODE_2_length_91304_cov_0.692462.p56 type:complete len:180 gc:universal NODE_2_length_91304_cov_0.692462:61836-61297(-)